MKQICQSIVYKDSLPILSHCNIIYKINCLHCEASYVRQTRRLLKNRIDEHKDYKKAYDTNICNYRTLFRTRSDFDWDNVKILDEEVHLNKYLIFKIYIKYILNIY